MKKTILSAILTVSSIAVVLLARGGGDEYASGVPSYRATGPAGAPVSVVVFSDLQCPACARGETLMKGLMEKYPGKIRFVFRHNPLRMHRWAANAARSAEAAGAQGKFWEYQDILFTRQQDWSGDADPAPLFLSYAEELGLDMARFRRDLGEGRWDGLLIEDMETARKNDVRSTPTFFIGGQRLVGPAQLEAEGERLVIEALK